MLSFAWFGFFLLRSSISEEPKQNKEVDDLRLLRLHRRQSTVTTVQDPSKEEVVAVASSSSNQLDRNRLLLDLPIRVVVRKRPLGKGEIHRGERDVLEIKAVGTVLVHEPKTKVDLTKVVETQTFIFDDSFDASETNEDIYVRTVKPLISFIFDGGKATCFAYGQTGSGKVIAFSFRL